MNFLKIAAASAVLSLMSGVAHAQTEITWWHAMGGQLGETVNAIAEKFNASQSDYKITPVFKGGYEDTLTAGIAAFRAGEQPNIMQVFDAGSATIIGAKGATIPVQDLFADNGIAFNIEDYISGVRYFYADNDGKMIGMPFNSSSPIMYYNEDALKKAGVTAPVTYEEFEKVTAPALKDAGYVPFAQSHLPWEFVRISSPATICHRNQQQWLCWRGRHQDPDQLQRTENALDGCQEMAGSGIFRFLRHLLGDNQSQFEDGNVAMWIGSSGSFGGLLQKNLPFKWSATNLPYWESITKDGYQTFIGGAALFAMSGKSAEENKATAAFFKFMSSPEIQYFWHKESGYVPITTAAYELAKKDGHYDRFPAAEVGIKQLSLQSGENTRGYRMGFYVQIRDVENREFTAS